MLQRKKVPIYTLQKVRFLSPYMMIEAQNQRYAFFVSEDGKSLKEVKMSFEEILSQIHI